jgi:hypothetical protein
MGEEHGDLAQYFDQCRIKRNVGTYDRGGQISQSEVDELIGEVTVFQNSVMDWMKQHHPDLV